MELTIDYECPQCHRRSHQKLAEFAPGQTRTCQSCGSMVHLTLEGLRGFEQALEDYCRT